MFNEGVTWEIAIIGLSLALFTLLNILTQSYRHKTDLLLSVWLVLLSIPFVHTLLSQLNIEFSLFHQLTNPTLNLLHGPILYLYVTILVSKRVVLRRSFLWHFVPVVFAYLIFINMSHPLPMRPSPDNGQPDIGPMPSSDFIALFNPIMSNFGLINALIFIAYSAATIALLRKHQHQITGIFSQDNNQISLQWIYALPTTFAIVVVANLVNENLVANTTLMNPLVLHLLCFLAFIILLGLFGVKQKPVFYFTNASVPSQLSLKKTPALAPDQASQDPVTHAVEPDSVEDDLQEPIHDISEEAIADIIEEMNRYMLTNKPYLDCDFSVYSLAQALNVPRRTLSLVLNNGLSKNFYQYVNEFRIKEVKARLRQPDKKTATIIDIAFQSGFNSKSSFNSLFKQHCGMTPSQFRKSISPSPSETKKTTLDITH